ncbi:MAG: hypothetical protein CMM94_05330 [Rickettsiales bacterium]|nr:hypothetical protein [Rickettsiales bacterium]|tara:strand:+ start:180 stop:500 length:321 start_codon:yes stop_codon:yes gene_type:complete
MAFSYFSSVESTNIGSVQEDAPYAANGVESVDVIAAPELDVAAATVPEAPVVQDQPVAMNLGVEAERMPCKDMGGSITNVLLNANMANASVLAMTKPRELDGPELA